jgi:hypothetical protein
MVPPLTYPPTLAGTTSDEMPSLVEILVLHNLAWYTAWHCMYQLSILRKYSDFSTSKLSDVLSSVSYIAQVGALVR